MALGPAAPLIIERAAAEPMAYDREVTLVLDDWATGTGRPVPATNAGTAGGRGSAGGMMSGGGIGGKMGGRGMGGMMRNADQPAYGVMTIKRKTDTPTEALRVEKGERVPPRVAN